MRESFARNYERKAFRRSGLKGEVVIHQGGFSSGFLLYKKFGLCFYFYFDEHDVWAAIYLEMHTAFNIFLF